MKKLVLAVGLLMASCSNVDFSTVIANIQKDAQQYCGVIVNIADLAVALSGQNPGAIAADQVAHQICDQYIAKTTTTTAAPGGCETVLINNKPVRACK